MKIRVVVAVILAATMLVGCQSNGTKPVSPMANSASYANDQMAVIQERGDDVKPTGAPVTFGEDGGIAPASLERKIITRVGYDIQTKDFTKTIADLTDIITQTGSFTQQSNTGGNVEDGNARASFTVRVPAEKLADFKEFVSTKLGNVINQSEGGDDVTAQYFDTETRLAVLGAQEKRVLELLQKAVTIEEIILIETELTRIRTEIEQLTTTIKRLDDLTSYATVNISIQQTKDYIVTNQSFLTKTKNLIIDSAKGFGNFLKNIGVMLIWALPYLIVLAIIFLLIRKTGFGIKFVPKRKKRKIANMSENITENDKQEPAHESEEK